MKRIVFITGHYGSGKTEISLNLAIQHHFNWVIDLDVINPYFRSREHENLLSSYQIRLLSSDVKKGTYIDTPFISKHVFQPFINPDIHAIYDLGGSDLGAKLLRQFQEETFDEVDFFFVVNTYRPETQTVESIRHVMATIESSSGRRLTGLIHNSNLLNDTTMEDIQSGQSIIEQVSEQTGLPIVFTCVAQRLVNQSMSLHGPILPLQLYLRPFENPRRFYA